MTIEISKIRQQNSKASKREKQKKSDASSIWQKDIRFGKVISDKHKEEFYSELVILLTSGLDLKSSLDLLIEEQDNERPKKEYDDISKRILYGNSFSDAVSQNKDFSMYEYYSLKIGEESGQLVEVMEELTQYFRKKMKQRKQMTNAFSYPVSIFFIAFVAVFFMLNFVVPLFGDAFLRFNGELPALTQGVIAVSEWFRKYWLVFPVLFIGIAISIYSFRKKEWYRKIQATVILKMPVFGALTHNIYLARFCQSMALMTSAHTPLVQALDLVGRMMGLYPFEIALAQIRDDLFHGKLFHESLARFPVFEKRMAALIKVGEETNRLDVIFKRLYEQYSEEADHRTSMISAMLEPVLIVIVGGMVAVILIAMYLPMFKLGDVLMVR